MTNPFAAQPHPLGLDAVPAAQAVFDAELDDEAREVSIPADDELQDMKKPDLVDLAERLKLDSSGNKPQLMERISAERKRRDED